MGVGREGRVRRACRTGDQPEQRHRGKKWPDHRGTSRGVVVTGSLEGQTLALLWEGDLECQGFLLKAMGSHEGFWSRRCWRSRL